MLARARQNLRNTSFKNVIFKEGPGESLPFPNESFVVVISNGAFNLIPDKAKALGEVFRILKPRGGLMIADQVLASELPRDMKARVDNWAK